MTLRFPNESPKYRLARDELLEEELVLRRQMEMVARARRALPPGGLVTGEYVFDAIDLNGTLHAAKLGELFGKNDTLVIYSMMFPRDPGDTRPGPSGGETAKLPLVESPCPSCTALLDQLDGAVPHLDPHVTFVVVAKAPIATVVRFAHERGWRRLRFVSSTSNTYNRDYHAETQEGAQRPMLNVFQRTGAEIRHFWGSEMLYAPTEVGQDPRHVGTLEPVWNLFDLTPGGRGENWDEQFEYGDCCH